MEIRPEPIRTARRPPILVLVAVVALTIAAVAVAASLAVTAPRSGALDAAAAGASAAPIASPGASGAPGHGFGRGNGRGPGMFPGFGFFGGVPAVPGAPGAMGARMPGGFLPDIRITAIDGAKVSLQSANGWSRTVDTTGVTVTRAGATIPVSGLKVGDRIAVTETRNADGTFTVTGLTVVLDQVSGAVSKVDAGSITVTAFGNKTVTITTSAATVYRRAGQTIARSDITVGDRVTAEGTSASDESLVAQAVDVLPDVVFGTVTKKAGDTLTITTAGGGTAMVKVSGSTSYQVAGKASATLADIAVNDTIVAEGVKGADGVLNATVVRSGPGHGMAPMMRGWGGPQGPNGAFPLPSAPAGTSG